MAPELLTLRDLRVQTLKERREGRLTKIPNTFYKQVKNLERNSTKLYGGFKSKYNGISTRDQHRTSFFV